MSFQHDEQEFDFSYMFEYNQDVQGERKVGEFPSAKAYPLYYIPCIMQFQSTAVTRKLFKKPAPGLTFSILMVEQEISVFIIKL